MLPSHQRMQLPNALRPTPGSNVSRIYGISDCVIAVAFTLFAENIRLPSVGLSASALQSFVINELQPDVLFYLGAYLVVASSWISHYRVFTYLRGSSNLFILLNVVFLASVVFLPVPVALFYRYDNQAGVWQIFAATESVTSTTLLLMWIVARADHLLDAETPAQYLRYTSARLSIISFGTSLSFALAFFDERLAEGVFVVLFILGWIVHAVMYYHRRAGYPAGTTRMCSITDNMTAVALTFLISTIAAAVNSNIRGPFSLTWAAIAALLLPYGMTFLIVGLYWLSHHRLFLLIRQHDLALIWLNFVFLFFIELQPTFNSIRATYPDSRLTSILYVVNQAFAGLALLVIWLYAALGHRLIERTMGRVPIMVVAWRTFILPLLFLLTSAVVFFRHDLAVPLLLLATGVELTYLLWLRLRRNRNQASDLYAVY